MNLMKMFWPRLGVIHGALLLCGAYVIGATVTEAVVATGWTLSRVLMLVAKVAGGVMLMLLPLVDMLEDRSFDTSHDWRFRRHVAHSLAVLAGLVTLTCLAAAGALREDWPAGPLAVIATVLGLLALWLCIKLVLETG